MYAVFSGVFAGRIPVCSRRSEDKTLSVAGRSAHWPLVIGIVFFAHRAQRYFQADGYFLSHPAYSVSLFGDGGTAVSVVERHLTADTGMVCAGLSESQSVPAVCIVEYGVAVGAGQLSVCIRTIDDTQGHGVRMVGSVCGVCGAVRNVGLVKSKAQSATSPR